MNPLNIDVNNFKGSLGQIDKRVLLLNNRALFRPILKMKLIERMEKENRNRKKPYVVRKESYKRIRRKDVGKKDIASYYAYAEKPRSIDMIRLEKKTVKQRDKFIMLKHSKQAIDEYFGDVSKKTFLKDIVSYNKISNTPRLYKNCQISVRNLTPRLHTKKHLNILKKSGLRDFYLQEFIKLQYKDYKKNKAERAEILKHISNVLDDSNNTKVKTFSALIISKALEQVMLRKFSHWENDKRETAKTLLKKTKMMLNRDYKIQKKESKRFKKKNDKKVPKIKLKKGNNRAFLNLMGKSVISKDKIRDYISKKDLSKNTKDKTKHLQINTGNTWKDKKTRFMLPSIATINSVTKQTNKLQIKENPQIMLIDNDSSSALSSDIEENSLLNSPTKNELGLRKSCFNGLINRSQSGDMFLKRYSFRTNSLKESITSEIMSKNGSKNLLPRDTSIKFLDRKAAQMFEVADKPIKLMQTLSIADRFQTLKSDISKSLTKSNPNQLKKKRTKRPSFLVMVNRDIEKSRTLAQIINSTCFDNKTCKASKKDLKPNDIISRRLKDRFVKKNNKHRLIK